MDPDLYGKRDARGRFLPQPIIIPRQRSDRWLWIVVAVIAVAIIAAIADAFFG